MKCTALTSAVTFATGILRPPSAFEGDRPAQDRRGRDGGQRDHRTARGVRDHWIFPLTTCIGRFKLKRFFPARGT